MKRFLCLLAVVALAGCDLNTGPKNNPTDPTTETFAASLGVDIPNMTKAESNGTVVAYYKDITVGTGPVIDGDAAIGFIYTGYIKNGTSFDTGTVPITAQPQETVGNLIVGMQLGLQGMKVGGERLIVVPSEYGYQTTSFTGSTGVTVGANSTLIFDIKLTDVQPTP